MWLPNWLYEVMPLIYALAGILAILQFHTLVGYVAGALLLLAAGVFIKMRVENRNLKETIKLARYLNDSKLDSID
jgi:hypothetical protein